MAKIVFRKAALAAAAAALAFSAAAPAAAGVPRHHGWDKHHRFAHGHYRAKRHYYYGSHRHRGGLSGGEAALIAAGIIGGAILIDRALDDRRYDARYEARPYPRYGSPSGDRFYYRRDDSAGGWAGDYDDFEDYGPDLSGRGEPVGPGATYNYGAAYNDCKAETRAAADQAGLIVSLPAKPQRIAPIKGGEAVRFTADLFAEDRAGRQTRKMMVCEADLDGVRFLEIV